jgi:anti-sigma B factor antagonist
MEVSPMPFSDSEIQDGPLTVRTALDGERIRLSLVGELDLSNAHTVESVLEEAYGEGKDVLVDLGPLEFLDSTGIALLVRSLSGSNGARLSFLPSESDAVRRLLNMTGLDQRLPLAVEDEGELLRPLPPA